MRHVAIVVLKIDTEKGFALRNVMTKRHAMTYKKCLQTQGPRETQANGKGKASALTTSNNTGKGMIALKLPP